MDKDYPKAVEAYSKAIKAQPENAILYSNRALTYLRMEQSEKALQDTEIGLKLQPSNVKLLFRKAKSLIQLKRYEEAASFLEKASQEDKEAMKEKAFAQLVKASKRMVEEAKLGKYDIMDMMEEAKRSPLLDSHADYYAMSKFEMKNIVGKGRGLVAREKVEAGTLLMACKAFIFADISEKAIMIIDQLAKTRESFTFAPMVQKVCHKLLNNPELSDDFYKLHAGRKLGWLEKADHLNPIDIERIVAIKRINSFYAADKLQSAIDSDHDAGIWIMPSYLNHSCVDINCFTFSIGDFLFVRAIKDVQPGEELLVQYVQPDKPFEQRRQIFDYSFQLECSCRLCQAERNEPEEIRKRLNEVEKILDEIDKNGGPKDVVLLEKLLDEAKKSRPNMEFNYVAYRIQNALSTISPRYGLSIIEELYSTYRRIGDLHKAYAKCLAMAAILGKEKTTKWMKNGKGSGQDSVWRRAGC